MNALLKDWRIAVPVGIVVAGLAYADVRRTKLPGDMKSLWNCVSFKGARVRRAERKVAEAIKTATDTVKTAKKTA